MLCLTNPVNKPSLEILPIWIQHACPSEFLYRFLSFSIYGATMGDVIIDGKVCLQHHDLLNYQTDLFKTDIFRKLMIQH